MSRAWIACLALSLIAGCSAKPPLRPQTDRNVLSTDEMYAAGYADAFTTVQSLRPQWLQRRGVTSINQRETVKVYLDGSLLGGPEFLQQITIRSISSMRFLDGLEASQRWGLDHGHGAILVLTRKETSRT